MIRPVEQKDLHSVQELFTEINLFEIDEVAVMVELTQNVINGTIGANHYFLVNDDNGINAAAYYAPESFAPDVYNLYFIGVILSYTK